MRLINDDVDVVSMCKLHAEWPIDAIILYVENGHASLAVEFPGGVGGGEDGDGQLESDGDSVVKVLKLGPNRTIRPGKLRTPQFCSFFSFNNRSMGKKQGSVRTVVELYGSKNRDWFLRFRRFLFLGKVSANTSTVLWVSSDLEPNEREKNKNKNKNREEEEAEEEEDNEEEGKKQK